MVVEFVCVRCGEKFTRERSRRGGNPPQVCEACKVARAHDYKEAARRRRNAEEMMKRAAVGPAKPAKIVKRCRLCGRVFEEKRLSLTRIADTSEGYVEHRYCPNCRLKQRRAAQACDPRYIVVGGHGGILEDGTIAR